MKNQLDWQVGDDEGGWEIISAVRERGPRKPRGRLWGVLLATVVLLTTGGGLAVRSWYHASLGRIRSQIQDVVDQEAQAQAESDLRRLASQQDMESPVWFSRQVAESPAECPETDGERSLDVLLNCFPRAQVKAIEVRGDTAWVEVITDQRLTRQARFYRLTDRGWKHTAPDATFWGDSVELDCGLVTVRCHERDLPHVEALVEHILRAYEEYAILVGTGPGAVLEVHFVAEVPSARLSPISGNTLTLPSPWLMGIPADGAWADEYLDEVTNWVGYAAERMLTSGIYP
jgi:hypothetical protein